MTWQKNPVYYFIWTTMLLPSNEMQTLHQYCKESDKKKYFGFEKKFNSTSWLKLMTKCASAFVCL